MRDDIHKRVPRPPAVQEWVRRAVNDADRLSGRSARALEQALYETRREISKKFLDQLSRATQSSGLFGPLAMIESPRELGGNCGPAEMEILSEAKRRIAAEASPSLVVQEAVCAFLKHRAFADIRATAAVLPENDRKSQIVLEQMRSDVRTVDILSIARAICGEAPLPSRQSERQVDPDEELRAPSVKRRK